MSDRDGPPLHPGAATETQLGALRIGRYVVQKELGRGGMGAVFLARDESLQRTVAIKVVTADAGSTAARDRFLREARSAAQLTHPNIATIYEIGEHEGQQYIAMEHVEGATLSARLRSGPLDVTETLALARQLASALARAHAAGIVHRDVKPGNVMLANDGQVKLLDFGLARPADADTPTPNAPAEPLTATGVIVGTPGYLSPEQARGERVTTASDVFSLGALLYEAVTGRPAFRADNTLALLVAVTVHEPAPPRTLRADVPPTLDELITSCLDKQPTRRPAAQSVVDALEAGGKIAPRAVPVAHVAGRVIVLPFKNTTRDPTFDWVGAGLTDTIGHELRRSSGVTVAAESGLPQDGQGDTPGDVARRFGAEWAVHGSFQVIGGRRAHHGDDRLRQRSAEHDLRAHRRQA